MRLPSFLRRRGTREDREGLVDTPAHSDTVEENDDILAREDGPRPTARFRRLQRRRSSPSER